MKQNLNDADRPRENVNFAKEDNLLDVANMPVEQPKEKSSNLIDIEEPAQVPKNDLLDMEDNS